VPKGIKDFSLAGCFTFSTVAQTRSFLRLRPTRPDDSAEGLLRHGLGLVRLRQSAPRDRARLHRWRPRGLQQCHACEGRTTISPASYYTLTSRPTMGNITTMLHDLDRHIWRAESAHDQRRHTANLALARDLVGADVRIVALEQPRHHDLAHMPTRMPDGDSRSEGIHPFASWHAPPPCHRESEDTGGLQAGPKPAQALCTPTKERLGSLDALRYPSPRREV
jgi:hypothetical protein